MCKILKYRDISIILLIKEKLFTYQTLLLELLFASVDNLVVLILELFA